MLAAVAVTPTAAAAATTDAITIVATAVNTAAYGSTPWRCLPRPAAVVRRMAEGLELGGNDGRDLMRGYMKKVNMAAQEAMAHHDGQFCRVRINNLDDESYLHGHFGETLDFSAIVCARDG